MNTADLLREYNTGVMRARHDYALRDLATCRRGHAPRPRGERCRECVAEGNRRRKGTA